MCSLIEMTYKKSTIYNFVISRYALFYNDFMSVQYLEYLYPL